jgi:hypothetical protein
MLKTAHGLLNLMPGNLAPVQDRLRSICVSELAHRLHAFRECVWSRNPLHFFGSSGIRLGRGIDRRELPPYPEHYLGPWLGPRSFAVASRAGRLYPFGRAGGRLGPEDRATHRMSQFRDDHTHKRRCPTRKTGGLVGPHGRPRVKAPSPTGRSLLRVNYAAEGEFDGPMSFAFADPLSFPTDPSFGRSFRWRDVSWASDVATRQALDTLRTRGRISGFWARSGVIIAAS